MSAGAPGPLFLFPPFPLPPVLLLVGFAPLRWRGWLVSVCLLLSYVVLAMLLLCWAPEGGVT